VTPDEFGYHLYALEFLGQKDFLII
jgi:hypothetical protein